MTTARDSSQDASLRLAQRLVRQGRLDQPLAKTALGLSRQRQIRLEDALIECGVSEHVLLRHLADLYRTQLVSTEKLEHAKVSARVLRLVPRNVAERHLVMPIVLTARGELVVATPDPESVDLIKDVQLASQVREVKTTVARPAAIQAAIRKFYDGDALAFNRVAEPGSMGDEMALEFTDNQGGPSPISERPLAASYQPAAARRPAAARQPVPVATQPRARLEGPAVARAQPPAQRAPGSAQGALQMAPATAAGAATLSAPPLPPTPEFNFADPVFPPTPAAPRAPSVRPGMEMELELAVSEQERAELNQSGRGRQWDRPAQAPEELASDPMEFSVSDFSQASLIPLGHSLPPGAPVAVAVALAEAPQTAPAAPEGSLPPLLAGFALSAPPVAAVPPAAADPVGSLPPALGLFASAPPVPIQHHPPVAPAAAASSVPPLLDFNSTPPAAAAPASGATAASVVEHSMPPALGLFDAPPEPLAAPAGLASAPPGPATTEASAPVAEPSMLAPLSVPPSAQALEASVPYELTQGRKLLGAPLLFARTVVALHERSHGDLTGHSVVLSELMRMLAGDLGLSPDDQEHAELAGLLHDVAKSRSRHLTALAVWTQPEHEKIGREQYLLPLQMLGSAGLPTSVVAAITHVYERVDGSGFPNSLGGSAIPLLARLIAVCDSYLDLVLAAGNPLGGVVSASEAIATLREKSGTVFDTALVERLANLVVERRFDVRTRQRQVTL